MAKLHLHRNLYRNEKEKQHMFKMQEIGARIAEARRTRGLTQYELAEQMGISFQAVSGWERGVSMPDIARLPELCAILGMSVDAMLGNAPMPEPEAEAMPVPEPEVEPEPAPELEEKPASALTPALPKKRDRDALLLARFDELDSEDIRALARRMCKNGRLDDATFFRMVADLDSEDMLELARIMLEHGAIPAGIRNRMIYELDEDDLLALASALSEQDKLDDDSLRRIAKELDSDDVAELARILADHDQLTDARLDLLAAEMDTEELVDLLSELEEERDRDTERIVIHHKVEPNPDLPYDMRELGKVYVMMSSERRAQIIDELLDAGARPADLVAIFVLAPRQKQDEACARWLTTCRSIADFAPIYAVMSEGARRRVAEHYLAQGDTDGIEAVLPLLPADLRDRVIAEKIRRK